MLSSVWRSCGTVIRAGVRCSVAIFKPIDLYTELAACRRRD